MRSLINTEECRWQDFFDDPTQWWDNRAKTWKDYPDFKHVNTGRGLWINSPDCPNWVALKLQTLKEASPSQNARAQYTDQNCSSTSSNNRPVRPESVETKVSVSVSSLLAALKDCTRSRDLKRGRKIHAQAIDSGFSSNIHVLTSLINMYAKSGSMLDAETIFGSLARPNVVAWNCLIWGYVDNGEGELALKLFDGMRDPDGRTFVAALSACAALGSKQRIDKFARTSSRWLEKGEEIHSRAVNNRCCDIFVETSLIDMYAQCGSMKQARLVFDKMSQRNVVAWNALLQGYVENGESKSALELFEAMGKAGRECDANSRSYVAAISACTALAIEESLQLQKRQRWLENGRRIFSKAVASRCCDTYVQNTMLDLFAKCGSMDEAREVFDKIAQRNVVSWTALMQGYVENGFSEVALEMFEAMKRSGCAPQARTFVAALSACADLAAKDPSRSSRWLAKGKSLHSQAVANRCCDNFVKNTLVSTYAKCGSMGEARSVFDEMVERNVVSWTALIMGYAENGESEQALEMISAMDSSGVGKNSLSYVAALTACGNLMALDNGKAFHEEIRRCGLERDVVLGNCLVDFYGKCGSMESAKEVFDAIVGKTLVSWNSLMCGYSFQGDAGNVFEVFDRMREEGFRPDDVSFVCLLTVCSHAGLTDRGKEFFDAMQWKFGIHPNVKHYACLVDLLGRANHLEEALKVVKEMPVEADAVIWTSVLGACRKWKNVEVARLAFEAFEAMKGRDASAYVLMTNICRDAGFSVADKCIVDL